MALPRITVRALVNTFGHLPATKDAAAASWARSSGECWLRRTKHNIAADAVG
jgi:hypothetical protein